MDDRPRGTPRIAATGRGVQKWSYSGGLTSRTSSFKFEIVKAPLFRLSLRPTPENGLHQVSQIMVDKMVAVPRDRVRDCIGAVDDATLLALNRCLALMLGLAGL